MLKVSGSKSVRVGVANLLSKGTTSVLMQNTIHIQFVDMCSLSLSISLYMYMYNPMYIQIHVMTYICVYLHPHQYRCSCR